MTAWLSYARASSDEQTASCPQQHVENERAERCPPAGRFDDDGVRGIVPVLDRAGFSRLLEVLRAAPRRTYKVRLYEPSRLGRFRRPAQEHFAALEVLYQAGAADVVYTIGGERAPGILGDFNEMFSAHTSSDFSKKLSARTHRGKIAALRAGRRSGGFPPHGYDLEYLDHEGKPYVRVRFVPAAIPGARRAFEKHVTDLATGRVEVIPAEHRFRPKTAKSLSRLVRGERARVEAIETIFAEAAAGRGIHTIAVTLERRGLPSPEGNGWSSSGVYAILTNPVYTGASVYGRRSESEYHRLEAGGDLRELSEGEEPAKTRTRENGGGWLVVPGTHEALVARELFDEVDRLRTSRSAMRATLGGRARARRPFLLSGLLCCPRCGRAYVGQRSKNTKGIVTPYYICGGWVRRRDSCAIGSVRLEAADDAVLDFVAAALRIEATDEELLREARLQAGAWAGGSAREPDRREIELAEVDAELAGLVERLTRISAANLSLFDVQLGRLRERRDRLLEDLRQRPAVPAKAFNLEALAQKTVARARRVRELLQGGGDDAVLALREEVIPAVLRRALAYPPADRGGVGYLELEGWTPAEAGATPGRLLLLDVEGIGRANWVRTASATGRPTWRTPLILPRRVA